MSELQTPPVGTEPTEQVTPSAPETETPQIPAVENPPEPTPAPQGNEPPVTPQPQTPEGFVPKDKFVASARESILNVERVKVANAQIDSLTKTDTPTDDAMRLVYPEWDNLDDYNKRVLVRQETLAMQQNRSLARTQEIEDRQRLEDQLDSVIDGNPKLAGKAAEFKRFARDPKNRGISAETLAKACLYDAEDETPAPNPNPTPMTEALPTGSGGPRDPLTPKKISIEEAAEIRKTDYKRYKELLDSNMIEELDA
jgi:hypothetical protein